LLPYDLEQSTSYYSEKSPKVPYETNSKDSVAATVEKAQQDPH